ncbi:MAG: hypothetical protein J6K29_10275 [Clostridia bacterium]|nr:hypothetical protein [Clostridia bacterium]
MNREEKIQECLTAFENTMAELLSIAEDEIDMVSIMLIFRKEMGALAERAGERACRMIEERRKERK